MRPFAVRTARDTAGSNPPAFDSKVLAVPRHPFKGNRAQHTFPLGAEEHPAIRSGKRAVEPAHEIADTRLWSRRQVFPEPVRLGFEEQLCELLRIQIDRGCLRNGQRRHSRSESHSMRISPSLAAPLTFSSTRSPDR